MENRTFAVDTVEYRDAYLKKLMGKPMDEAEMRAIGNGANVIPTQTLNKIYGLLEEHPLLAEINALHIPGYVSVPKVSAFADASWVAMGTAATDGTDTLGSVSLSAYKLIKTLEINADVKAMSIPAFEGWLANKLADKMAKAIAAAIINGSGSSEPTGLLHSYTADVTGVSTVAKLGTLLGKLGSAYHSNAVWVMSSATFYGTIMPLCSDKNGIFVMNGIDKMLLGHKVILEDTCDVTASGSTTKNIILADLENAYVFNYGEGIDISADGSVAFRTGSVVYRAMALADGKPCDTDAYVVGTV